VGCHRQGYLRLLRVVLEIAVDCPQPGSWISGGLMIFTHYRIHLSQQLCRSNSTDHVYEELRHRLLMVQHGPGNIALRLGHAF